MVRITGCRIRLAVAFAVVACGLGAFAPKESFADQAATPPAVAQPTVAPPAPASAQSAPAGTQVAPAQAQPAPPAAQAAPVVSPAPGSVIQIAKSALLAIEGTPTADTFDLRIHKISDKSLISSDDVTVTVDGHSESVTRVNVDTYQMPLGDLRGDGAREVEIIVPHDGIREILSGKITLPQTSSTASLLRDHKQVGWWILNIVIVLIAAIAISRRKG
jgi:hypothetical protein